MNTITFPGLGFEVTINPVAFSVFGIDVYWYGVIIVFGILLTPILARFRLRHVNLTIDDTLDLLIFCLPMAIVGCRVYYCLFDNFNYYIKHPLEIITGITNGGLAFYGGLIFAVTTGAIVMKVKKKPFLDATDLAMPLFLLAQGIGRWGNFVNGEAYGGKTDLPWRMIVEGSNSTAGVGVHPTFFYESLWCIIGFIILYFLIFPRRKFRGEMTACYLMWYGFERFFVEGLRSDSLYLGNSSLRVSQALSLVLFIVGAVALVIGFVRAKDHPLGEEYSLAPAAKAEEISDGSDAEEETTDGTEEDNGVPENGNDEADDESSDTQKNDAASDEESAATDEESDGEASFENNGASSQTESDQP